MRNVSNCAYLHFLSLQESSFHLLVLRKTSVKTAIQRRRSWELHSGIFRIGEGKFDSSTKKERSRQQLFLQKERSSFANENDERLTGDDLDIAVSL